MTEIETTLKALSERVVVLEAENAQRKAEIDRILMFLDKQTSTMQQISDIVIGQTNRVRRS